MIQFTSVEYKNLQSVGNHPIKIQLDKSPTTVIGGQNGTGKSTMLTAIAYGLFGKLLSGMKLANAINSVNKKQLLVKVSFVKNGEEWMVVRGEKPKKFEIYRNDELMDQYANARDQQKFLEIILGMDFKLFTQIVILNKERYVPFMEMGAAERRKIVEDILDISVFTEMNEVCKQKIKEIQRTEATVDREREVKSTELRGQQNLVAQITESIKAASEDLQAELDLKGAELVKLINKNEENNALINDLRSKQDDKVKKQRREFEKLAVQFDQQIKSAKKNAAFFEENDNCPTCQQGIGDSLKNKMQNQANDEIKEINGIVSEMMGELEKVVAEEEKYDQRSSEIDSIVSDINVTKSRINSLTSDISSLEKRANNASEQDKLDHSVKLYHEIENALETLTERSRELILDREQHEMLRDLLKDDGIKATIVREYNALINKKINDFLNSMNFYINMRIDENFKESFHAMHKENFSYENLSTGQKARVNLAIWLAFLEVASVKNSVVTNILMLDEILENLDAEGVKDFMALCNDKLSDKSIFVVTQRFDEFQDMFRSSIRFKLNQGFTEVE